MPPKNRKIFLKSETESLKKKIFREFLGILFLGIAVFAFVSLTGFSLSDPSFNQYMASGNKTQTHNYGGIVGAYLADSLIQFFGGASFLPAAFFLVLAWGFIRGRSVPYFFRYITIWTLITLSLCAMFALYFPYDPFFGKGIKPGGMVGFFLSSFLVGYLNKVGSYILVATLLFLSMVMATRLSINATVEIAKIIILFFLQITTQFFLGAKELFFDIFSTGSEGLARFITEKRELWKRKAEERRRLQEEEAALEEEMVLPAGDLIDKLEGAAASGPSIIRDSNDLTGKQSGVDAKKKELQEPFPFYEKTGRYKVPPVSLLEQPPPKEEFKKKNEEELILNARILEKKLEAFGVQGKVVQVLPGPVITLYEYEPGTGVKVSKIMNLSDDLALSMRALTVRILAPVPGKAVVGIEIPNRHRETVYLREVLSSNLYQSTKSKLTIAIGHDTAGQPVVADLAQIPHLLIAGSTGSGKSVGVNGMICSILLKAKPEEVKFIMIDPKMLELSTYEGIPHLLAPVVTDPKKAASVLRWAVEEMERRYKILSGHGVRNIQGYNKLVKERKKAKAREEEEDDDEGDELLFRSLGEKDEELKDRFAPPSDEELTDLKKLEPPTEIMPYIVVVIDELADLMMTAPKEVEISIARLAQMARASGIHMIVATQRPSVDVLTGLIKANFPARIAYKVATRVDSRTILDHIGAEKLLGKGDLLFVPPGASKLERIHGCWVSDLEVKRVVDYLKHQQKPVYVKDILKARVEEKGEGEDADDYDPMYDEAVALVTATRTASISMVQRKLRIGYNRAARMIEKMEQEGVVGPSDGVKQREVYAREI